MSQDSLRVGIDHQIFSLQEQGGISRYFVALYQELQALAGVEPSLLVGRSNNRYLQALRPKQGSFMRGLAFKGKMHALFGLNQLGNLWALRTGYDVLHPTYYRPEFLQVWGQRPFVLTVHDMIPERYPEHYAGDFYLRHKRKLAARATRVIAISEQTKADLVELYGLPGEKIDVVYHGNSLRPEAKMNTKPEWLPQRYLLYVGDRRLYKRWRWMVQALQPLFAKETDLHLLCIGGGPLSDAELELAAQCGLRHRRLQQRAATEAELSAAYTYAAALVYPSEYEGFGMPILEAFAHSCPVVVAKWGCLEEVAGQAAAYFERNMEEDLLAVTRRLLGDDAWRAELVAAGKKREAHFTWRHCAEQTLATYRKALVR